MMSNFTRFKISIFHEDVLSNMYEKKYFPIFMGIRSSQILKFKKKLAKITLSLQKMEPKCLVIA